MPMAAKVNCGLLCYYKVEVRVKVLMKTFGWPDFDEEKNQGSQDHRKSFELR